jgi:hypothetical protein
MGKAPDSFSVRDLGKLGISNHLDSFLSFDNTILSSNFLEEFVNIRLVLDKGLVNINSVDVFISQSIVLILRGLSLGEDVILQELDDSFSVSLVDTTELVLDDGSSNDQFNELKSAKFSVLFLSITRVILIDINIEIVKLSSGEVFIKSSSILE